MNRAAPNPTQREVDEVCAHYDPLARLERWLKLKWGVIVAIDRLLWVVAGILIGGALFASYLMWTGEMP